MTVFEYAPAPESTAVVRIAPSYGLFINGEFAESAAGARFTTVNPATEEPLAEVSNGSADDVDRAVAAAHAAFEGPWGRMKGRERAKYLYRIARIIQERSREFAVLESLDNGKPIRESRDVDIPLGGRHFFHHAGWADKLEYAGLGPSPRPLGVAGQIIPWNFPLLMAVMEARPRPCHPATHCILKPAETTPLTALPARGGVPAGRPAARRRQRRDRRGDTGAARGGSRRPRQGCVHRFHRGRQSHPCGPSAGTGKSPDAQARWQGSQHRLRRRAHRPGGRRDRERDLLQPGRSLLRRLTAPRTRIHPRPTSLRS